MKFTSTSLFLGLLISLVGSCVNKAARTSSKSKEIQDVSEIAQDGQKYCHMSCGGKSQGSVPINKTEECVLENAPSLFSALPLCSFEVRVESFRYEPRCVAFCPTTSLGHSLPVNEDGICDISIKDQFDSRISSCNNIKVSVVQIPNYTSNPVLCRISCRSQSSHFVVPHSLYCSASRIHEIANVPSVCGTSAPIFEVIVR
ncbi:MAG: hypothetical protein NT027_08685 [Proteobacteria bacterium]|nr:hypothetical protein [Pseudomonadota bacterium]